MADFGCFGMGGVYGGFFMTLYIILLVGLIILVGLWIIKLIKGMK